MGDTVWPLGADSQQGGFVATPLLGVLGGLWWFRHGQLTQSILQGNPREHRAINAWRVLGHPAQRDRIPQEFFRTLMLASRVEHRAKLLDDACELSCGGTGSKVAEHRGRCLRN